MIAKEINITHTGQILASFIIGLCLCLWTALNMKPSIGVAIGFIPFATLFIFICINSEGGNLAASKIRNLECPNYEICLIDYGCGKFNRKIHIMEQYP